MEKQVKGKRHQVKKRKQQRSRPDQPERYVKKDIAQEEKTEALQSSQQPEQPANSEGWEKQPRVNEDEQRNIVNHPEHTGDDIHDTLEK
ncbi:MAG TPA: hypothetical protein VIN08_11830 [Ohtaekwangia sp.]|uniref:hypothetical protein n=1 Tax=Ohtaekwangia sp. TaxID=2066019 RepID=UPI002F948E8C